MVLVKSLLLSLLMSLGPGAVTPVVAADAAGPSSRELTATDARAVRAVVEAQLKALAGDQAAKAFAYATPAIQAHFHDADLFMAMVRQSYPMLIRPAAVSYFKPEAGGGPVARQSVQFRDRDGRLWRAVYALERQADKQWRIAGCAVAPDDGATIT